MTVHTQPAYQIRTPTAPPADYPARPVPDTFAETPFLAGYEARRQVFLDHLRRNPAPANTKPAWHELGRLAAGGTPHPGLLLAALDFIDARKDCADFVLHGILRLLYQFAPPADAQPRVPAEILDRARATVLNFKYFPDEPGTDSLCTWTENHYILYTSAAYLAGHRYPEAVFTNSGETGLVKAARNRLRLRRWLALRFHTGFSEWLSHVYYDEDFTALLALVDFAPEEDIRRQAEMVLDLLLLDLALNSFKGVFGSTHGRAYENTKKWAAQEGTTDTAKLLFGTGIFSGYDNMSAVAFALSRYRLPPALETVAAQGELPLENRQRMGIRLKEMETWGLHPDNFEDGMLTLTLEAYLHPRTIANTLRMFDTCRWWDNAFLKDFKPYRNLLKGLGAVGGLPWLARALERDVCRNTREEVNVYSYRTADYLLSTAQDYRPGYGGDQQHIWQATLGPDAVCFTTHPAKIEGVTPNYWAGSGLLPRAAQYRQVTIVVYRLERIPALYVPIRHFLTHAWFPRAAFDEVLEQGPWKFARKGDGYLALWSYQPLTWGTYRTPAGDPRGAPTPLPSDSELIAAGARNVWICQMGRRAEDGTFTEFVQHIGAAALAGNDQTVTYRAPGVGTLQFGWTGPLQVDQQPVPLGGYARYDNSWIHMPFNSDTLSLTAGPHRLQHDWPTLERITL